MRPGPGSASWTINAERIVVLAWPRAILLQFAHPLVAAGVAAHSTFRTHPFSPLARLHGTVRAMLDLTFGEDAAAEAAAARINRIHDRVHGQLAERVGRYPAGMPYSAHDPALLAWVQITLLESMPLAFEHLVGPLAAGVKDAYCTEARDAAAMLGIPADMLPGSYADVQAEVAARLEDGTLVVGPEARSLARDILNPRMGPIAWPGSRQVSRFTTGLLPPALREAYGLDWTTRDAEAFDAWTRRVRRLGSRVPRRVRTWGAARVTSRVRHARGKHR